jgi:TolB protein
MILIVTPACGGSDGAGPGADRGSLQVVTSTTGSDLDPDGYSLTVDEGPAQALGTSDTLLIAQVDVGDHQVLLDGVATNCDATAQPGSTVTVTPGGTSEVSYTVTCAAIATTGTIQLTVSTNGLNPDPDGYTLLLDGRAGQPIAPSVSIILSDLAPGPHSIALDGVAPNCTVGTNPTQVTVLAGSATSTAVTVTCTLPGHIIFAAGAGDIFQINTDGTGLQQLTSGQPNDGAPAWSPDGSRIAFWSDREGGGIFLMNPDGTSITRLTTDQSDTEPAWAPDGQRIAFYSRRDDDYEIYVVDIDGSHLTRLTNHPGFDGGASWSPDGSSIVFSRSDPAGSGLFTMNPDGTNLKPLTQSDDCCPSWSPDGTQILFNSSDAQIMVINADGTGRTNLTNTSFNYESSWSPDGRAIVYVSDAGGMSVMNSDGTGKTSIRASGGSNPSWGP